MNCNCGKYNKDPIVRGTKDKNLPQAFYCVIPQKLICSWSLIR